MTARFTLENRVALVTGGASGIGLGMATALLSQGATVVIGDIRADHLDRAAATLVHFGDRVRLERLDVTSPADWTRVRSDVKARHGALHVLCLNAGIGVLCRILQAHPHDWAWLMGVNLRGVTLGLEICLPLMRARNEGGRICATSSMGGLVVADDGGIYSTAKFGVVALMECLRTELARENIGVSVLCPAAVNTNIHDHGTMRPREFSNTGLSVDPAQQRLMTEMARSILAQGADPLEVGERVVEAMLANEPYVFTDGRAVSILQARRDALLAATRCVHQ